MVAVSLSYGLPVATVELSAMCI